MQPDKTFSIEVKVSGFDRSFIIDRFESIIARLKQSEYAPVGEGGGGDAGRPGRPYVSYSLFVRGSAEPALTDSELRKLRGLISPEKTDAN